MAKDNRNTWQKQKEQRQKIYYWVISLFFLAAVIVAIAVPVSYVPLFSSISQKFGLSNEIARKLTLVDLAFSSLGVETKNMKETFKKVDINYEPSVFLSSRYETQDKRLLDARKMYYNEYEYTHKRPAEIAGIYQDGKETDIPEISAQAVGVRSVPEGDNNIPDDVYLDYETGGMHRTSFSGGNGGAVSGVSGASASGAEGQTARKARQASDRDTAAAKRAAENNINSALPQFANSIYDKKPTDAELSKDKNEQAMTETLDLNNSRIIKPILQGSVTSIGKKTSPIESLMNAGTVSHVLGTPGTFGGHEALGYYVGDDLPKAQGRLLDYYYFGSTGMDVFNSYYYSYAATSRRYKESAKYLAEITFNGADAKNEILVAPGQSEDTVTRVANEDSAFEVMAGMREHNASCSSGHAEYDNQTKEYRRIYKEGKEQIKDWSANGGEAASHGAPGSCERVGGIGRRTEELRIQWNQTITNMMSACRKIWEAKKEYAQSCGMTLDYADSSKDDCESLSDLKVLGGNTALWVYSEGGGFLGFCNDIVKWNRSNESNTFNGCDGRVDCGKKIPALFEAIEMNVSLEVNDDFVY